MEKACSKVRRGAFWHPRVVREQRLETFRNVHSNEARARKKWPFFRFFFPDIDQYFLNLSAAATGFRASETEGPNSCRRRRPTELCRASLTLLVCEKPPNEPDA